MQIHISRGEDQSGPFTLEEVREQLSQGKLQPDDLACQEGGSEWIPISELMNKLESSESTAPESSAKGKTLKKIGKILAGVAALAVAFVIYAIIHDYQLEKRNHWVVEVGYRGDLDAPPIIGSDGTVYVRGDKLLAMNGETGDVVWEFDYLRNNKYEQSSGGALPLGLMALCTLGAMGVFLP